MPSLREIAEEAGVSITTASRVLNQGKHANQISQACAEKVRAVAARLGYTANYHARSMKLGRAETVGVAIDLGEPAERDWWIAAPLSLPFFGGLLGGIERHLRSIGYRMMTIGGDAKLRAPDRGQLEIHQRRIDGLIVLGSLVYNDRTRFLSEATDDPIVVLDYAAPTPWPVIDFDDTRGMELAISHLADLGHKELLWVGPNWLTSPQGREKHFVTAAWDKGLRGSSVRFDVPIGPGLTRYRDGLLADAAQAAVAKHLADNGRRFTGIVCYNDVVAIGAVGALQQAGLRVPQDVSVIGFDDVQASLCNPRLTSVGHQLITMGERAAEMVMAMVNDHTTITRLRGTRELIDPELVVRQSTGPAPRG